jgi:hypothetical protein
MSEHLARGVYSRDDGLARGDTYQIAFAPTLQDLMLHEDSLSSLSHGANSVIRFSPSKDRSKLVTLRS